MLRWGRKGRKDRRLEEKVRAVCPVPCGLDPEPGEPLPHIHPRRLLGSLRRSALPPTFISSNFSVGTSTGLLDRGGR